MGKVNEYYSTISEYLSEGRLGELKEFLKANSNLPGPRGNLEMAYAFGDCFDSDTVTEQAWEFLLELSDIHSSIAPTNDPSEMLPFCAALAAGSYYIHADEEKKARIRVILKAAMNDGRWRMREVAAMGYQRIAESDFALVKEIFDCLYPASNFLEKRAIIAALAHPPILGDRDIVLYSIRLGEDILSIIAKLGADELKSEEFKTLSKGLEYALSVFVAHAPEEGFTMLRRFAAYAQKDIRRIIKSNLAKTRLTKKFPGEVDEVLSVLNAK